MQPGRRLEARRLLSPLEPAAVLLPPSGRNIQQGGGGGNVEEGGLLLARQEPAGGGVLRQGRPERHGDQRLRRAKAAEDKRRSVEGVR